MAGLKRKEAPVTKAHASTVHKRSKKEAAHVKTSKVEPSTLEAETDSDPIAESDTTDHSGDDDGVSWPSDEEEDVTQLSGKDETLLTQSATDNGSIREATGTNDINAC
jgi:hypothetical protein